MAAWEDLVQQARHGNGLGAMEGAAPKQPQHKDILTWLGLWFDNLGEQSYGFRCGLKVQLEMCVISPKMQAGSA